MATILIVDDRPTNRELLITLLGYAGHQTLEAADGEAGLAIARAARPDLIITDIVMPKMDGYEFARQVRADPLIGQTQIIFHTSSYIVEETYQLAKACGVSYVIGKPIEPEHFIEQVQIALDMPPVIDIQPRTDEFHHEHMRLLTDTLAKKVQELEAEITERKQAETALKQSEERYRSLFENTPIAIWEEDFSQVKHQLEALKQQGITDLRAHFSDHPEMLRGFASLVQIVDVNKATIRMYEAKDRTEMLTSLGNFFHRTAPESFLEEVLAIARGETTFHWEGEDQTLTGKKMIMNLNWTVAPGHEDNYVKVIVSTVDITETRLAEERLRALNAELEQRVAERTLELTSANRAKDEFLATMSHELRTPLNSILGLSETLLEELRGPLTNPQRTSLQIIESSGRHLLELINDVLDLSKIEAGKFDYYPQTVDVDVLCRSSLAFVKEQALRKSITLEYLTPTSTSQIHADPRRLKQILVNLLTNAVKFTPNNGQVTLQVTAQEDEDLIQFSVHDTGIGIAPGDMPRLFQPFVQVDSNLNRQFEGTGLGLALVQRLTDMHGGSVAVESTVGQGSRFTINLPWRKHLLAQQQVIESGERPHLGKVASKPVVTSSKQALILLAEDNETNILTVGEYLKSHGFQIVTAYDGAEALEKAEALAPDLILMDIQMPVMDGLEAIRQLRMNPRFDPTPIIALTALAMPGDRERCLEAGANEYLSKPVSLKMLKEKIETLLR